MLQPCYKVALDLKRFEVLGKLLFPLTLYHCRCLESLDCPIISGGDNITAYDVAIFITICMLQNKSQIDEFLAGDYSKEVKKIVSDVAERIDDNTANEIKAYLDYYQQMPERDSNESGDSLSPWWGMAKNYLVTNCGYNNRSAWDCIVAEAFCEIAFHSARHGDKTLVGSITYERRIRDKDKPVPTQEELKRRMAGIKNV